MERHGSEPQTIELWNNISNSRNNNNNNRRGAQNRKIEGYLEQGSALCDVDQWGAGHAREQREGASGDGGVGGVMLHDGEEVDVRR